MSRRRACLGLGALLLLSACSSDPTMGTADGGTLPGEADLAVTGGADLSLAGGDLAAGGSADLAQPISTGSPLWQRATGGSAFEQAYAVASDAAGNVIVGGSFSGTINLGGGTLTSAGSQDAYVTKLNPDGTHQWSRRYGSDLSDRTLAVTTDAAGNVFVVGYFTGAVDFGGGPLTAQGSTDVFVVKLGPTGGHLWSRRFGGTGSDTPLAAATDPAGNLIIGGEFAGLIDFGSGPLSCSGTTDGFLARLDPAGTATLARRFGGSSLDTVYGVAADASGNILAGGMFQATADFGGGPLTALSTDGFIVKLTTTGSYVFARRLGGTAEDRVLGVAADPSGSALVTGFFNGSGDFGGGPLTSSGSDDLFVAKYDPGGSYAWARRGGGTGSDTGRSIAADRFGNVVVSGHFSGSGDFGGDVLAAPSLSIDALLIKYGATGSPLYARRFGGSGDDFGLAVAVAPNADILLGGAFQGSVDFGGGILTAVGDDGFILRRAP